MIILGTSGSGKSTAAKLMLRTHLRNGLKCVCIDPEGELEGVVKAVRGDFIDLGKGGDFGMINPLEIVVDADDEEIQQLKEELEQKNEGENSKDAQPRAGDPAGADRARCTAVLLLRASGAAALFLHYEHRQ